MYSRSGKLIEAGKQQTARKIHCNSHDTCSAVSTRPWGRMVFSVVATVTLCMLDILDMICVQKALRAETTQRPSLIYIFW